MKNVISATLQQNGKYTVVFTNTSDKLQVEHKLYGISSTGLQSMQKQTSLLLWIRSILPNKADQDSLIQQIDSLLDLENELGFDSGIDAAVECHNS